MWAAPGENLIRALNAVTLRQSRAKFLVRRLAPGGWDYAAAIAILDYVEIELRGSIAQIARLRVATLAEQGLHVGLAPRHHHHCGVMQDVRMIAVDRVLERHLPVATIRVF